MKISGQINGVNVELGERPGPVEQDGQWWEAVEYHIPKCDEIYFFNNILLKAFGTDNRAWWIMRPIPRASKEQLKAIGMKERDDRPVEVKHGEWYWSLDGLLEQHILDNTIFRWVLEDAPGEKEPAPTSCEGCEKMQPFGTPLLCWHSCVTESGVRRNWTPTPAPSPTPIPTGATCDDCKKASNCLTAINRKRLDTCEDFEPKEPAPKTKPTCKWTVDSDGNWFSSCGEAHEFTAGDPSENGYLFCPYCGKELVMDLESMIKYPTEPKRKATAPASARNENVRCGDCDIRQDCDDYTNGRQEVCRAFVPWNSRKQAPAGERGYTVDQIAEWMEASRGIFDLEDEKMELLKMLNDPQDGIAAVTDKNKKENSNV